MYILSSKNIYKMEEDVKRKYNISETILMENAGAALFDFIKNTTKILYIKLHQADSLKK